MATANVEKMTRTAKEISEIQRDSYQAFVESFTASQRRGARLAQDGLKFFKLQEDNAKAVQEWFANGARLVQLQQRNVDFAQEWSGGVIKALREQTDQNLRAADAVVRNARKQQESLQTISREWAGTYGDFFAPSTYVREGLKNTQKAVRQGVQVAEQGVQATQKVAEQGLRVAEQTADKTEEILRQTEEATREAELRTAAQGALGVADYDALNVGEVSKKLDGLSTAELKKVREYEKRNKNRETLIEQIDRKIKAAS